MLFTPLKHVVIPPPMSASKILLQSNICEVSFSSDCINLMVHTTESLSLYYFPEQKNKFNHNNPPQLICQADFKEHFKLADLRQIQLLENSFIAVESSSKGDQILNVSFVAKDSKFQEIKVERTAVNANVFRLYRNPSTESIYLQLDDGSIKEYLLNPGEENQAEIEDLVIFNGKLPNASPLFSSVVFEGEEYVIALSKNYKLYINGHIISPNCNSYKVHDKFLCYTTLDNKIRFIHLQQNFNEKIGEIGPNDLLHSLSREVEEGSSIVCVVPFDSKIVLQMPRGNLETIYPRCLMLEMIRTMLDSNEWNSAFELIRKHKIDSNFMCDHNLEFFLSNIEKVVTQLPISWLNIFIAELMYFFFSHSFF